MDGDRPQFVIPKAWSVEEDSLLRAGIAQYWNELSKNAEKTAMWTSIAAMVGTRNIGMHAS